MVTRLFVHKNYDRNQFDYVKRCDILSVVTIIAVLEEIADKNGNKRAKGVVHNITGTLFLKFYEPVVNVWCILYDWAKRGVTKTQILKNLPENQRGVSKDGRPVPAAMEDGVKKVEDQSGMANFGTKWSKAGTEKTNVEATKVKPRSHLRMKSCECALIANVNGYSSIRSVIRHLRMTENKS